MSKAKVGIVALLFILFFVPSLHAFDFGLLLNQNAGLSRAGGDPAFDYKAVLIPRFSALLGDSGEVFVSAGMTANYENEQFTPVPELLRTEFSWRFSNEHIRAGRLPYADPLYYVVDGLFDGAQVLFDTSLGTFSAGAWYTGLLYKKTANITITPDDLGSYSETLDYGDFAQTYFTSRRLLAAFGWEHPALAELIRLKFAITGQFDLNDRDARYHSQYFSLKAGIPVSALVFDLGGCIQLAQEDDEFGIGLVGELGASLALPSAFQSQLSLNGRFSSGRAESGPLHAFVPVTTVDQGKVLGAKLSGISVFSLDYAARFHRTFSSLLAMSYFMRGDLGTYVGYPLSGDDNEKYALGGELFGQLIWSPVSDLRLNLGFGVFIPGMGNVAPDADPKMRIELGLVVALY